MFLNSLITRKISLILFCSIIFNICIAQKDNKYAKKELKYYKKHINEYTYFKEDFRRKDSIVVDQEYEISSLRDELNQLKQQRVSTSDTKENTESNYVDTRVMPAGKSFQIQVGLYKNTELSGFLSEPKYLGYELDKDLVRYHIGYFNSYIEAKNFIDIIKKMGITDAFITEYFDGERINYTNTISNENNITPIKNTTTKSNTAIKNTNKSKVNNTPKMEDNWEITKDDEGNDVINVTKNKPTTTSSKPVNTNTTSTKPATTTTTSKPTTTNSRSDEKIKMQDNWKLDTDEYGNEIIKIMPK
jgi:hypothetical protein